MEKLTLEEIKYITIEHMKKDFYIIDAVYKLDPTDFKQYQEWYINHPYCRGIREIQELVRRGKTN